MIMYQVLGEINYRLDHMRHSIIIMEQDLEYIYVVHKAAKTML